MIAIIINLVSGGARLTTARQRAELATAALAARGEQCEVFVTEQRGHARRLAETAVGRGARMVVAWGGDGTINEVGSALIFGPTPLAIVPSGSGNGLARELGIPLRPADAIALALEASVRPIDAGELSGRFFFNMAGIGFDAHVAACLDRDVGGRRGLAAYVRICARELLTYRAATYRICDSSARSEQPPAGSGRPGVSEGRGPTAPSRKALLVTLANSPQFGNGARIAPAARLDDGRLDLVVFEETSRLATVCAVPRLFTGGVSGIRGWSARQIERATIESDTPMRFHVDGEPVPGGTRLEARVHPGALNVCVRPS